MRLEVVRIVTDWLRDDTYGINAFIPTVPRDVGDDEPPSIGLYDTDQVAVLDETRHIWVAERREPPIHPAIYVVADSPVEMKGEPTPNGDIRLVNGPVVLAARYLGNNSDRVAALRDGEYTLRALVRSIREMMKQVNEASRTRNNVCVTALEDPVTFFPIVEDVGSSRVTGAVTFQLDARDAAPSY